MTRFEFFNSIEQTLPVFFPELKNRKPMVDFVFIDHTTNKLIFTITFHMKDTDGKAVFSDFQSELKEFKMLLLRFGVINMEDMIMPEIKVDYQKYFFTLPADIMVKLTD